MNRATAFSKKCSTAILPKKGSILFACVSPAGGTSRPHFHSQDRFVTVIEGTWNAGIDASHDMTTTTPIPAGGYMMHPAGAVHYDGSRGGPVVVEIRGFGPVSTTGVDIQQ